MEVSLKKQILFLVLNTSATGAIYLVNLAFQLWGRPTLRAFRCNDPALSYPIRSDTVSAVVLFVVGGLVPLSLFVVVEIAQFLRPSPLRPRKRSVRAVGFVITELLVVLALGSAVTVFLTQVGKFTVGRPRPHFLTACLPSVCAPNGTLAASHGSNEPTTFEQLNFIVGRDKSVDPCTYSGLFPTEREAFKKTDVRLSFPSGHASVAFYTMVFAAIYVEFAVSWAGTQLLRYLLQAGLLSFAIFVGLSRVLDYKHHPTDVLAGSILGIAVAIFTVLQMTNWIPVISVRSKDRRLKQPADVETGCINNLPEARRSESPRLNTDH